MTSVSDVSSIFLSNYVIMFVSYAGARVFSLGLGDWEFDNFRKLGEPFWHF